MIVLDAIVLIAHLDADDAHHERATALLLGLSTEPLGASPISVAEVLVGPAREGRLQLATHAVGQLGVSIMAFDNDAPARLAVLRAATRLKLPDCCVLLSAQQADGALATFDEPLAHAARHQGLEVRTR